MSEAAIHKAVATYLNVALQPPTFWTTIGHGAFLGEARFKRGAQMKRAGVKAGVPDILVIHDGRAFWIELKAPKGRLSEAQHEARADLIEAGCQFAVCKSVEDVSYTLGVFGIPKRARAA